MKITVVIPTFNEASVIQDCLNSLNNQSVHNFEVIVVDDGSTDKTNEVLQNFQFSVSNFQLKIIQGDHKGAGYARNLGVKEAKGDILVFVDADMTFDRNFIKNLIKPIENGKAKGTFSKDEYVSNWQNSWARCWNINEGWENKKRHPKNYPNHQPVFRAILKREFDKVGGFTPGGYDDDWSLSKKLGYEALDSELLSKSKAIFFHKNPASLYEVFNHAKWVGKRRYKLGQIGYLVALIRTSLPVSLLVGLIKSLVIFNYKFLIFKLIYDLGVFLGILNIIFTGNASK